jgi:hypothetical protein
MTELITEPDGGMVPDFHVKLQSDIEPPAGNPGKSLIREVELLRLQLADLCRATHALVTFVSVLDKKVDTALKGGVGADFAVL